MVMYRLAEQLSSGEVVRVRGTSTTITILKVIKEGKKIIVHGITPEGFFVSKEHTEITKNI